MLCVNARDYYALDTLLASRLKRLSFLTRGQAEENKIEEGEREKVPSFIGQRKVDFM